MNRKYIRYEPYIPTHIDPAINDAEYVKSRIQINVEKVRY